MSKVSAKILVIDDETTVASLTQKLLIRLGHEATVEESSAAAYTTFIDRPDDFDIVITDHHMPGQTGIELAQKMLRLRPDLAIILYTGDRSNILEKRAKECGIDVVAWKPVDMSELDRMVKDLLGSTCV